MRLVQSLRVAAEELLRGGRSGVSRQRRRRLALLGRLLSSPADGAGAAFVGCLQRDEVVFLAAVLDVNEQAADALRLVVAVEGEQRNLREEVLEVLVENVRLLQAVPTRIGQSRERNTS